MLYKLAYRFSIIAPFLIIGFFIFNRNLDVFWVFLLPIPFSIAVLYIMFADCKSCGERINPTQTDFFKKPEIAKNTCPHCKTRF